MSKSQRSVAIIGTRGYPSYYGGFETAVRYLAPFLADRGWRVTVYGRPESIRWDDPARDPRVEIVVTRGMETRSLSTLSYGLMAVCDCAVRRHDIALVMNVANGFFLPILKARRIPTLVNVDGIEWHREKWGKFAKGMFRTGARLTATFANGLVVDSREIGRYWNRHFGRSGAFIPYGGESRLPGPPPLALESRAYVLFVARLVPENSVREFFAAADELGHAGVPVVIVGSSGYGGGFDGAAQQLAASHPSIQWLGHLSNDELLHSLWEHAGVYFHGHSVGGTNPALVQAMALGAPVLARDTVFNREVIADAGWFVEPNPESIAREIRSLLCERGTLETMSTKARARARQIYSWDSVCERYEEELLALLDRAAT